MQQYTKPDGQGGTITSDMPRGDIPTPCDIKSQGCPKGHYDNQKVLSVRNRVAYQHYKECKAVGQFPDDAIVRMNASVIAEVHELTEKNEQYNQMARMGGLLSLMGGRS